MALEPREQQVYRSVLRRQAVRRDALAEIAGLAPADVDVVTEHLVAAGLLAVADGQVTAVAPERLFSSLVDDESARLMDVSRRLDSLRSLLPALLADREVSQRPDRDEIRLEVAEPDEIVPLLQGLAMTSTGDLLWLRPDQWRLTVGRQVDDWVRQLIESGRRSRVIYPARVLEEAPEVVQVRAAAGEHVRVLAEVPARVAVLGSSAVVMHEEWRANSGRLVIVRQPSIVEAFTMLFDHMWDRALNVPGHDGQAQADDRRSTQRMLLDQMVRGAKDEQIARALGISLRTVRRRVAEIMDDLGAESRFQAGVEAVRRGWV